MNKAKSLVNNFVEERLQGNLSALSSFDFAQLRGDKKYGFCRSNSFDCDNTNLANAIYLLVFEDIWKDLTYLQLENRMYRGDTINSFNTTFGRAVTTGGYAGLNRFNPDKSLLFNVVYHWDTRLTREGYLQHVNQYLDFCEASIEKRGTKWLKS